MDRKPLQNQAPRAPAKEAAHLRSLDEEISLPVATVQELTPLPTNATAPLRAASLEQEIKDENVEPSKPVRPPIAIVEAGRLSVRLARSNLLCIVAGDMYGNIFEVNGVFLSMLGYTKEEFSSQKNRWAQMTPVEYLGQEQKALEEAKRQGFSSPWQMELIRKDGSRATVFATIVSSEDKADVFLWLMVDLSEQEKALREIDEIHTQLAQASKLASLGTLCSMVAHELNNPLSAVRGYAKLIDKGELSPARMKEYTQEIIASADRMQGITDYLRSFARKSNTDDWKQLNINDPIEHSLTLLRQQLAYKGIKIELSLSPSLPRVWADPNQIESILHNLLTNSRDAFDEIRDNRNKTIRITTETHKGGGVQLIYEDNGCGIKPEVQEKMFELFFTTKGEGRGTGLGMSIVKGIIAKHRGHIDVKSKVGVGARFTIFFPEDRRSDRPNSTKKISSEKRPALTLERTGQKQAMLIVDDDLAVAKLLSRYVEDDFDVKICTEPAKGVEEIKRIKFDVIIADLNMPEISGLEILFRAKEHQPETPVIMTSGQSEIEKEVQHAISRGAVGILEKPYKNPDEVRQFLKAKLSQF